jgi:hypothetical protein
MGATWVEAKNLSEAHVNTYDCFILIKVNNLEVVNLIKKMGKRVWYDLCDPSHWFHPKDVRMTISEFDGITASNEGLAKDLEDWGGYPVTVIPDRLELEHYSKRRHHTQQDPVRFVWYGASQNRMAIYGGLANLDRLAANGHNISLTIYDDQPQTAWPYNHGFPIFYGKWRLDHENGVIAGHDIAYLPPYPGPWGKVKSKNKELTAWACGLPVTDGQDYQQMSDLVALASKRQIEADIGYQELIADYTVDKSAEQWKELLSE